LLGPASIDRWTAEGRELPGGGALNMAYHWARAALPSCLLTRVGSDDGEVVLDFLRRNEIGHLPGSITAPGRSAAIDVVIDADRQPHMDNFVEGVWHSLRLTPEEEVAVAAAVSLHCVLVDPVDAEVHRLGADGALAHLAVSGDFLDFRHFSVERFAATMRYLALGFVGWPGDPDDAVVHGVRSVAADLGRTVVVTLGSRGVLLVTGSTTRLVTVRAVAVEGTTVGCGDAFIAAFLARHLRGGTLDESLDDARAAGAAATGWLRPLPDDAYAPLTR
jgi:sugar/nucleoside kinase (ribokinase family)